MHPIFSDPYFLKTKIDYVIDIEIPSTPPKIANFSVKKAYERYIDHNKTAR